MESVRLTVSFDNLSRVVVDMCRSCAPHLPNLDDLSRPVFFVKFLREFSRTNPAEFPKRWPLGSLVLGICH